MGTQCNTMCSTHFQPYYSQLCTNPKPQEHHQQLSRYHTLVRQCFHKANEGYLRIHCYTLNRQVITDRDMPYIVQQIEQHEHLKGHGKKKRRPTLLDITLGHNRIRSRGIHHLAISSLTSLRYLDLRMNRIGDRGCEQLSKAKWDNLEQLYLEQNQIGQDGCCSLVQAEWPALTWLDIKNNVIGRNGYTMLKKRFEKKCYIECDWQYKD